MKRILIAIVLLMLLAGGGFLGLDYYARQEAIRRVDATLQSLPSDIETSRGEVRYAFLSDTLQIDDLVLTVSLGKKTELRVARLTLSDLGEMSDGRISIGHFVASGVDISIEDFSFSNPQLDQEASVSGTGKIGSYEGDGVIIASDYAETWATVMQALLSGGQTDISSQMIEALSVGFAFDSLVTRDYQADFQLVIRQGGNAPVSLDYSLSMPESRLDGYKDGRLDSMTFASFDLDIKNDGQLSPEVRGLQLSVTSGAGTINGMDVANSLRLHSAIDAGAAPVPLLGDFKIANLSYGIKTAAPYIDLTLAFDSIAMADYRLRPGYFTQLILLEQSSDLQRLPDDLKGLIESYYLGRFEFSGMSFHSKDVTVPQVDIGHLLVEKFEGARLEKVLLEGFSVAAPGQGKFRLAALEIGGFDYTGFMEHLQTISESNIWPRGSLPTMNLFRLSGLDVDVPQGNFALGNFLAETSDYYQSVAIEGHMEMTNLTFNLGGLNDQGQIASAVTGVDVLDISMNMDHSWDIPSEVMDLKNITLTLNGLGKVSLDLSIAGAGDSIVALMHGDDAAFSEADALRLALKSARVVYEDQGLLSRFYETMAALQGLTPDQVRAGFVAEAAGYAQILRDPALVRDFDRSLRSFAANPKSLEIRLDPSEPISLALMTALAQSAPDELARALVPSIAVNQ